MHYPTHSFPIETPSLYPQQSLDLQRLAKFLETELGFKPEATRENFIAFRLSRRARELGYEGGVGEYLDHLFRKGGFAAERHFLADVLTTNTTDFFREKDHFVRLNREIVPALLDMRSSEQKPLIKVWSAASSNGAEAYSVAMLLHAMARVDSFRFSVVGTDISKRMLEEARTAIYPADMAMKIPSSLARQYVMRQVSGANDLVRIAPELRRHVAFSPLNLTAPIYPLPQDMDVVFLRNVLIYFSKDVQAHVLERTMAHLRPGGYLIVGHSEAMAGVEQGFRQAGPGIFRKL